MVIAAVVVLLNFGICFPLMTHANPCSQYRAPNAPPDYGYFEPIVEVRTTEEGESVRMTCDDCEGATKTGDDKSRWKKMTMYGNISSVERDIHDDPSKNRIFINSFHTLRITNIRLSDMGYYFCYDPKLRGTMNKKEYLVEVVKSSSVAPLNGEKNDIEDLYETTYKKYTDSIAGAYYVPGKGTIDLRNYYVYVDFQEWGRCQECGKPSIRSRKGICRLFKNVEYSTHGFELSIGNKTLAVPRSGVACRSHLLDDLPELQQKLMQIPDFIWTERCQEKCRPGLNFTGATTPKTKLKTKVKDIFRGILKKAGKDIGVLKDEDEEEDSEQPKVTIRESEKAVLVCPSVPRGKVVQWYHNGHPLTQGILAHETQGRAFIDSNFAIQIRKVLVPDSGRYLCTIFNIPVGVITLIVIGEESAGFFDPFSPYGIMRIWLMVLFILFLICLCIQHQEHLRLEKLIKGDGKYGYKRLISSDHHPDEDSDATEVRDL